MHFYGPPESSTAGGGRGAGELQMQMAMDMAERQRRFNPRSDPTMEKDAFKFIGFLGNRKAGLGRKTRKGMSRIL